MTIQLWATAVVSIVGNVLVVANGLLAGRNARRLALTMRAVDIRDARRKDYEESCRQFLIAARELRAPGVGLGRDDEAVALSELRRALSRIELYNADLADGPLAAALTAVLDLIRKRSDGSWSESIAEAEAETDSMVAAARTAISADLHGQVTTTWPAR